MAARAWAQKKPKKLYAPILLDFKCGNSQTIYVYSSYTHPHIYKPSWFRNLVGVYGWLVTCWISVYVITTALQDAPESRETLFEREEANPQEMVKKEVK